MLKLLILITGALSFLNFVFPNSISSLRPKGDVLGIKKIETSANYNTVKTAVEIYCLNKGTLPQNLNLLYGDELSSYPRIDLNVYYQIKNSGSCEFQLFEVS